MGEFAVGDIRSARRGEWLFDRIVATGGLVLRELGEGRGGEMAAHRFLSSPHTAPGVIVAALGERTALACEGRRVVVAQDTTEINFAGRGAGRRGLGPAGDGRSLGFFIHALVAVDAQEETLLGVVDAQIWTRASTPVSARHTRAIQNKESWRWIEGAQAAAERLAGAAQVIVVGDREADIWGHFVHRPPGVDLLVRCRHDRALEPSGALFDAPLAWEAHGAGEVKLAPRGPGDKGRTAQVVIRSGTVRLVRPAGAAKSDPQVLELGFVEVSEPEPPAGAKPIHWRLLTTLPVDTPQAAKEAVRLYRLRWRIEEVFRALKRDGLRLEDTQVEDAERLFRLAALALGAAARILQLVDARDGGPRPMSDVLDQDLAPAVAVISKSREGATQRQKNPHPEGSLAWLAWVVARYGGWNCYYKPPGPKTMAHGWQTFAATLSGFLMAKADANP